MNFDNVPEYAIHTEHKVCGFFGLFRWLSNFFPSKVHYEGLDFPSVENAYQAAKYPQKDRAQFTMISAGDSKKLGQKAELDVKKWDKEKYNIMAILVLQKFLNNPQLKDLLLATEDAYLEETNHWGDRFWGKDEDGDGKNNLGQILMGVRETIKKNKL
jgi:ribA/ribD-fused uncharacterized protein